MTPDQMQREERHASLMAVAHSLTAGDRAVFLSRSVRRYPSMDGADVADVLDHTTDYDEFLDRTEPFFARFEAQVPDVPAVIVAAHLIILMGWELTPARVWSVLQRAGVVEVPRYPEVKVGLHAHLAVVRTPVDANHLLLKARAEQGMRAAGVPEHEITEFREGIRATEIPGFGQNVADIARWVTLVDRYTPMPRKVYDPTDDIAALLYAARGTELNDLPEMANLRSHLDMRAPQTIKAGLNSFFGKEPS
jgi:hypothetical protein